MSEKRLSVRLAAVGGEQVKAQLMEIGRDGEQAMRRIERGAEPANAGLSRTQVEAGQTAQNLDSLADRASRMAQRLRAAGAESETIMARINRATGVSGGARRDPVDIQAYGRAMDDIRASANPAFAVIRRYRQEQQALRQAHNLGAISADEMTAAIGRERRAALDSLAGIRSRRKSMQGLSRDVRTSTFHTQNMMFQFQDMTTMMVSGQSPFVLAAQQGMQVTAIMQQMRDQGQSAFRAMLGGITRMLSPMSLLTIGVIAGAAALGQWAIVLLQSGEDAEEATRRLEDLEQVIGALGNVSRTSGADIEAHLSTAFSDVSEQVQALISDLRAAEFSVVSRRLRQEIESATGDLNRLGGAFDVFWENFENPGSVDAGYLDEVQRIIRQSGLAYDEFQRLDGAVRAVFEARSVTDFIARLAEARALAQDIGGPVGDSVAEALLRAAEEAGVLERVLQHARGAADDTASSSGRITSSLVEATNEAMRLRDALAAAGTASLSRQDQIAILRSQIGAAERGESVARAAAQAETARELAAAGATIDQIAEAAALAGREAETIERLQQRLADMRGASGAAGTAEVAAAAEAAEGWARAAESLDEYVNEAMDLAGNLGDGIVGAFQSAEKALDTFVRTGKANIRDFVTGIIADFARIGAQRFIFGPLAQALGGWIGGLGGSGLGNTLASVMHEGGVVGSAGRSRAVPAAIFAGAPRFHNGGWPGLRPGEVPIIAEKGERILSKEQARYGAGETHVHFHGVRDAESFRQSRAQVAADLGRAVSQARRGM